MPCRVADEGLASAIVCPASLCWVFIRSILFSWSGVRRLKALAPALGPSLTLTKNQKVDETVVRLRRNLSIAPPTRVPSVV